MMKPKTSDTFRDATERFARETKPELEEAYSQTRRTASQLYHQATDWFQSNTGKTVTVVAALTVIGAVGYLLGRRIGPSEETHF